MFDKLLATLPYNPSMVHQLSFYSRRMREESSVRRTGMIMLVLAFLIQFFAVISPPQPTVADSNNDLINGGFKDAAGAFSACDSNIQNYGDLIRYYGLQCEDFKTANTVNIHTDGVDKYDQHVYSLGRLSYGTVNTTTKEVTNQVETGAPGYQGGKIYARLLDSFYPVNKSISVLRVHNEASGRAYYVLFTCGNLATFGVPQPYVAPPKPTTTKPVTTTTVVVAPTPTTSPPAATPVTTPPPDETPPPNSKPCPYDNSILEIENKCVVCKYNTTILASSESCKPCTSQLSSENQLACISTRKTVSNDTAGVADANGTTAHASDVLTYTLYAQNNGKKKIQGYIFTDNISDTLDYATVSNLHGGAIDTNDVVTWPSPEIKAGETVTVQLTIKVKDPIPATPVSASDQGHFDLTMTNVFNNAVNVHLPAPVAKVVEMATTKLVNTGPGTSLFIGAVIMVGAGYFYSRSRLLATESSIAVRDNTSGGL